LHHFDIEFPEDGRALTFTWRKGCPDREKNVSHTPEDERAAARGFELCSRILKDHGFAATAAFYDEAHLLCAVKAQVLEDVERGPVNEGHGGRG